MFPLALTADRRAPAFAATLLLAISVTLLHTGCSRKSSEETPPPAADTAPDSTNDQAANDQAANDPATDGDVAVEYEIDPQALLDQRLPIEQAREGWIRLFDGQTLFGWEIAGDANWHVADGTITVDSGEPCLLCTSTEWHDYELTLEFHADADTNSGVFLRTPLQPNDPARDCFEVNIAPDDNPFPTASVVGRVKADADRVPEQTFGQWRRLTMRLQGNQLSVTIDGELVSEVSDEQGLTGGRIGLQKNSGRVAFRDIRLRPLGLRSLLDEELSQWKRYPEMSGRFESTADGGLLVDGGKTQLESRQTYGDFTLLAEYQMINPDSNSGIFFRAIPGDEMMGYECQVNDQMIDDNPLRPADGGTGGIFRRQDARIIAAYSAQSDDADSQSNALVLAARGPHFAAWVNGLQVSDVTDDRPPDENPRRGLRLEPGTLIIQGHDEATNVVYPQLKIANFPEE